MMMISTLINFQSLLVNNSLASVTGQVLKWSAVSLVSHEQTLTDSTGWSTWGPYSASLLSLLIYWH